MTGRATGPGRGVPRIWLAPIVALTSLLAAAGSGLLSRSVVLDLISWWPVWSLMAVAAYLARGRKLGRVRLDGVVPLLVTVAVALLTVGHLEGWAAMPSGSYRLVGPPTGPIEDAELSARVDGKLRLSAGSSEFLYVAEPVRLGGEVALPDAVERTTETRATVILGPPPEPGFYGFAGWEISLAGPPEWTLSLEGDLDVDLSDVRVVAAEVTGTGRILIGAVAEEATLSLNGDLTLEVEPGTAVRVVGVAEVPQSWERLPDGWKSPAEGVGWVVELSEASSLIVTGG